jgi:hypothetical protein
MQHRFMGGNHSVFHGKIFNTETIRNLGEYFTEKATPGAIAIADLLFKTVDFVGGINAIDRYQKKMNKLPEQAKIKAIFDDAGLVLHNFYQDHKEATDALEYCMAAVNDTLDQSPAMKEYYETHENDLKTFFSDEGAKIGLKV